MLTSGMQNNLTEGQKYLSPVNLIFCHLLTLLKQTNLPI